MPQNITDSSTFTDPVTAPADGDVRNASSVLTSFQALANRTRWLYNLLTSTGIGKIRTVADTTALKALASPVFGDVAILLTGVPQVYLFRSVALAGSDLTGMRYDSTAATGQWVSSWYYLAALSSGSPRLDVQVLPPPNRIVEVMETVVSSPSSTTLGDSGSWQDIGLSLTKNLSTGDIITLDGTVIWSPDAAEQVSFRLRVDAPGGSASLDGSLHTFDTIGANKRNLGRTNGIWTAGESGSHTFKMQALISAGGPFNVTFYAQRSLRGLWIRP